MEKLPYSSPEAVTDPYVDVILGSNDNSFFDPWGLIQLP